VAHVDMARPELASMAAERQLNAEDLFELGILCAARDGVDADLIAAHKWFNLAAMRGHIEAVYHRHQIADEMSAPEIAAAQRAAREWLRQH
jgi:TPR repeat protein